MLKTFLVSLMVTLLNMNVGLEKSAVLVQTSTREHLYFVAANLGLFSLFLCILLQIKFFQMNILVSFVLIEREFI